MFQLFSPLILQKMLLTRLENELTLIGSRFEELVIDGSGIRMSLQPSKMRTITSAYGKGG